MSRLENEISASIFFLPNFPVAARWKPAQEEEIRTGKEKMKLSMSKMPPCALRNSIVYPHKPYTGASDPRTRLGGLAALLVERYEALLLPYTTSEMQEKYCSKLAGVTSKRKENANPQ